MNYKKWVESHDVADIVKANTARHRLAREFPKLKKQTKIVDSRIPPRPTTAFSYYVKSQLSGISAPQSLMAETAARWKTLPDAEKKPYIDLALSDTVRYVKARDASGAYAS